MQGQRGTIGSSSETFEFDCGSTSSNAAVDQHIFWNNMRTPAENRIPEFILSPSDLNQSHGNSVNHEWQNLSGWSLGEPSSSNTQNEVNNNELKRELRLSPPINGGAVTGPRHEERHFEPTNAFSLDNVNAGPMYMCGSNPHLVPQNLNTNLTPPLTSHTHSHRDHHPPNISTTPLPNKPLNHNTLSTVTSIFNSSPPFSANLPPHLSPGLL